MLRSTWLFLMKKLNSHELLKIAVAMLAATFFISTNVVNFVFGTGIDRWLTLAKMWIGRI